MGAREGKEAVMVNRVPIRETACIWLDGRVLPDREDITGLPSALVPFTVEWGKKTPWDDPVPSVLRINLLDRSGEWSAKADSLRGHRISVGTTPTSNFRLFDGFVTDCRAVALDRGGTRLEVTASDRLYIVATDTRQGPNSGEWQKKGYQWAGSDFFTWLDQRMAQDGIVSAYYNVGSIHGRDFLASEQVSVLDVMKNRRTVQVNGVNTTRIDRVQYVTTWNSDGAARLYSPFSDFGAKVYYMGSRVKAQDTPGSDESLVDVMDDQRFELARAATIGAGAQVTSNDQYFSHVELRWYSQTLTNPGATQDEIDQAATYWTYTQDRSRLVEVDVASRDGASTLTIGMDEITAEGSDPATFDVSKVVAAVRESNRRARLPAVTFHSKRCDNQYRFVPGTVKLMVILGSKYEARYPATHGAWLPINGTVTFDPNDRLGAWSNEMNLWPSFDSSGTNTATVRAMKALGSGAQYFDANWPVGALRYVNAVRKP